MLAVAEMCVSFTTRTGSALMMTSGISTLQVARATTHWLAQRWMRPCSRQYTSSRCRTAWWPLTWATTGQPSAPLPVDSQAGEPAP